MHRLSAAVVRFRYMILALAVFLLVPSAVMYSRTKINYDMLSYLPQNIDTMKGQDILTEQFGVGAFSEIVVEGMSAKQTADLKAEIETVEHVKNVLWYDSFLDLSVPMELLPEEIRKTFDNPDADAKMMFILYDDTSSSEATMQAVRDIRRICGEKCFIAGMTPVVVDTQDLSDREAPVYVVLAVVFALAVLMLSMDSFFAPILFLVSIGMAIIYNLGTNWFLGSISYVTKALAAVLQLGVTMDYSIFLWHSYEEELERGKTREEAMTDAIGATFSSVVGSSVTTVAGFIALCFMSFTLGMDLGIVMAKGVIFGVVSCVTVLPSLILVFDGMLRKTKHRPLIPEFRGIGKFALRYRGLFLALALLSLIPSVYGNRHIRVYYNLDQSLPRSLDSIVSNEKLREDFDMSTNHMLMLNADVPDREVQSLAKQMRQVDGVKYVLGLGTLKGAGLPREMIPDSIRDSLENDRWQLLLIGSEYPVASEEAGRQCEQLEAIAKACDSSSMLIGEAPGTNDLIKITNRDFTAVSAASIGIIFLIILLVFRSISLPFLLVAVIEAGILANMAIPYYTGTTLPFIANIVIGTVQLGSTVDYAILLTTRYLRERQSGKERFEAVRIADFTSAKSIFVSALSFFAATIGVGIYSDIDMIRALCVLMARGALISMLIVVFVLPACLYAFDPLILKTTMQRRK
ncbi:efflux RND transporter permease subunit [Lachnoclostridium sp. Marseille-P6806]|uniref:efflux RND transporter permease subunit n=1 Tax=Lachnoclostridium sp. Marseille-P6806 TaxID=2364793 RepID=UPI001F5FA2B8|nr:MMPL family transporter [Lachnoclostridium sp. Marseille-P6806]